MVSRRRLRLGSIAVPLMFLWMLGGCGFGYSRDVYQTSRYRGVFHTIRKGQTLWGISRAYNVDVEQIAVLNGIGDPERLEAGVKIFIPGVSRTVVVPQNGHSAAPRNRPRWAYPVKRQTDVRRNMKRRKRRVQKVSPNSIRFDWPVRGQVVRGFGSRNGVRYDGIAISAPARTTVRAAAAGKVIFSDWGPGIFGRTVIIRHDDGVYHSVYAHNAINLVKRGQSVRRGTPIARVGQTGNVEKAQLHFEIRYRTKPRDPLIYLP